MSLAQSLLEHAAEYIKTNALSLGLQLRSRLRQIALDIAKTLQTPQDVLLELFGDSYRLIAFRIALDAGWLELLCSSSGPMTTSEISKSSVKPTEPDFVLRFMRLLAAEKFVTETAAHTFAANDTTRFFVTKGGRGFLTFSPNVMIRTSVTAPAYFAEKGYTTPPNINTTPLTAILGGPLWNWLDHNSVERVAFNDLMTFESATRDDWTTFYPCNDRLVRTSVPPEVLLVDIGGGVGHDLRTFAAKNLGLPGKLVLEDQAITFERMTEAEKVEVNATPYDFFKEQPIKNAGNYYMHHILHDWSDEESIQILQNQVAAMSKDSRLLINDVCLEDTGVHKIAACQDLVMMFNLAGAERSQSQWDTLLTKAGLNIVEIFRAGDYGEALIECRKA